MRWPKSETRALPDEAPTDMLINVIEAFAPWMQAAACAGAGPEPFFPEYGGEESMRDAIRVCKGCPVREDCLLFALRSGERFGVWGGLTPRQRARLHYAGPLIERDPHVRVLKLQGGPQVKKPDNGWDKRREGSAEPTE